MLIDQLFVVDVIALMEPCIESCSREKADIILGIQKYFSCLSTRKGWRTWSCKALQHKLGALVANVLSTESIYSSKFSKVDVSFLASRLEQPLDTCRKIPVSSFSKHHGNGTNKQNPASQIS